MNEINEIFRQAKNNKWELLKEKLLEDETYDANIKDSQNNYLLTYATLNNNIEIVKLLVEKDCHIDILDGESKSILHISIKYDYQDMIDTLLEINEKSIGISLLDLRDNDDRLPIHYCVIFNNIVALKKLIKYGCFLNAFDRNGYNALHMSTYYRYENISEELIKGGIDLNAKLLTGENALHISCNLQSINIAKLLINYGIDINSQDYEHEFTSLHYAITTSNKEIIMLLLKNGADVNIQDYYGNTVIHYIVGDNNYNLLKLIIENSKPNFNLWNIDSKIPLMLLLINKPDNDALENIELLLYDSDINLQDNNGNTVLHYLCIYELWEYFKKILIKKKMNILISNKNGIRPVDIVKKNMLPQFIDFITESYIFRLRNSEIYWFEEWENMCKNELFINELTEEQKNILPLKDEKIDKNTDVCKIIIKDKLTENIENKNLSRCSKSYPQKTKKCLDIIEGKKISICTFTGSTLDILIGLVYLLNKHKYACSTLSKNFSENKELCKFYKSIGISMNTKCEFLNFEIVWVHNKLYLVDDFANNFRKCMLNPDKRFIIIPVGIELREGSHANYLIYDIKNNEIERFEPHGFGTPLRFNYNPTMFDNILETRFMEIVSDIKYIRPTDYLPKIGFQLFDIYERNKKKIGDPGGFCALWVIWYVDMRLSYPEIDRGSLVNKMIKTIKKQNISFKNLIRNYAINILEIRDKILGKADLDVNDWLNDEYTDAQIEIVLKELSKEVNLLLQ